MSNSSRFYLYKRTNGIYYIGYFDATHLRWKSTRESLKSKALKALTNFKDLLEAHPEVVTLSKFVGEFLPFASANYSKCTADFYRLALKRLVSLVGNPPLSSLTMQHLDQYKVVRLEDKVSPVSPATINRELQALRAAMYTALRWKLIEHNPFAKVRFVQLTDTPPTYFSREAWQLLLKTITEEWLREILLMGTLTGMRRGEIINLRWSDINLQERIIIIQSSPTFRTKQGKHRVIPMNDVVYSLLKKKSENPEKKDYVFTRGGNRILDDHASKKLKKYVRRIFGKNCKLHFHSLRHTFATWLVQSGVNIYEVQKLLGHSSVKVTEVYSHLAPNELHHAVNKLSATDTLLK